MATETGKIEFIEHHQPALEDGDYTITVTQTIDGGKDIVGKDITGSFPATRKFSVLGPRFSLDPQEIQAVFPPPGSLGEHSNVLPHIILKRSTLPWERHAIPLDEKDDEKARKEKEKVPWLALLLFDEDDEKGDDQKSKKVEPHTLTLAELKAQNSGKFPQFVKRTANPPADKPYLIEEYGEHPDDKITVIDVKKSLLEKILPTQADLKWLTHARQGILFSVIDPASFPNELDKHTFPEGLRTKFNENHLNLSTDIEVSIEVKGEKWLVTGAGNQKTYVIKKGTEEGKDVLNISDHAPQGILFSVGLENFSDKLDKRTFPTCLGDKFRENGIELKDAEPTVSIEVKGEKWLVTDKGNKKTYFVKKDEKSGKLNISDHDEFAVIICNRLPKEGSMSTVHLVSVEGRYHNGAFDFRQAGDQIRLVSLKSWRFACVSEKQSFKSLLMHLNHQLLFNIKADGLPDKLKTQKGIPDELKQAFMASNHPLSNTAEVTDQSRWKITEGGRYYFVGAETKPKIYNQAGKMLFQTDLNLRSSDASKALEALKPVFEKHKHQLKHATIKKENGHWWITDGKYFVSQESNRLYVYHQDPDTAGTLRLPKPTSENSAANKAAEKFLKMGCAPLPHAMRQGNQTVSWYHGPLVPGQNSTDESKLPLPIRAADELVRYNADYGMFDASYAAAWELGRLLALQSKSVSVNLFNWKRTHAQEGKLKEAEKDLIHLPFDTLPANLELPPSVSTWFEQLGLLEGVPFNYLVPDERMLPRESIRFFQVDWVWVECLLDGAFSIGRVMPSDHRQDSALKAHLTKPSKGISGFLLRSDVVAGWPHLQMDGYNKVEPDEQKDKLRLRRMAHLSKNVLICLFDGVVKTVDIHQKPERLHFGVSRPDDKHPNSYKELRNPDGTESTGLEIKKVIWKDGKEDNKTSRVIDINQLAADIKKKLKLPKFTSAQFALQMIEGVEEVRFLAGG